LWENVANGGALAFEVNGTLDQQDRQALQTAKPVFRWLADHEEYYAGERSAARVLLLAGPAKTGRTYSQSSYRGVFRLLTEEHIPFAVSENMDWAGKRKFDLVIATDWAPRELSAYAESGGKVLIVSPVEPEFPVASVVSKTKDMKAYFRVRDHAQLPSLADTDLLMTDGPYTELKATGAAPITLVPPSMFGPPELVHVDMHDTDKPGLVVTAQGKGQVAWIPWDLGRLYYRESLPAHRALFRDVVNQLQPERQLTTTAHPLVEMTWMEQNGRQLLHLMNMSGHSQTGYFSPVPMNDIRIRMAGQFRSAQSLRSSRSLPVRSSGGYSEFVLPQLSDYELVVIK
jgi:hypothetical protein